MTPGRPSSWLNRACLSLGFLLFLSRSTTEATQSLTQNISPLTGFGDAPAGTNSTVTVRIYVDRVLQIAQENMQFQVG